MRAFEQFTADLESCHLAVRHLRTNLESELNVEARKAMKRQDALGRLPRIVRPPEANCSINEAVRLEGRTISKVEFGFREDIEGVHQSEALVVHFSEGSIMGIETGSNARHLSDKPSQPEDFHVDFRMHWVPPKVTKRPRIVKKPRKLASTPAMNTDVYRRTPGNSRPARLMLVQRFQTAMCVFPIPAVRFQHQRNGRQTTSP